MSAIWQIQLNNPCAHWQHMLSLPLLQQLVINVVIISTSLGAHWVQHLSEVPTLTCEFTCGKNVCQEKRRECKQTKSLIQTQLDVGRISLCVVVVGVISSSSSVVIVVVLLIVVIVIILLLLRIIRRLEVLRSGCWSVT